MLDTLYPNYIKIRQHTSVWQTTGPLLMTKLYKKKYGITIFPSSYFYPIAWWGINDIHLHKKIDLPNDTYMFQYGLSTNKLVY